MKKNHLDKNGRIPTYKVENEYELLQSLDDNKPSKRIVKTKKGLKAIKALMDLEKNHNESWYQYLKNRSQKDMNNLALFYRGTKISYRQMFNKADDIAKAMHASGLVAGDEIGVCISNSPEFVYILLAANKLGLKVNSFGADFEKEYLSSILDDVSKKVIFISDDNYSKIKDVVNKKTFNKIVLSSLSDSLPEDPTKCDEYEPMLDKYYHYENKVPDILNELTNGSSLKDFVTSGQLYDGDVPNIGDLETDFLISYTSGSTKIGHPDAVIHKNRSLNVIGRFHDPELCGNPKIPGLRGLAYIHPETNTDIITCISDNLMQGWSVGLEPEYTLDNALDTLYLNKPNYADMTTSNIIDAAKQSLLEKKHWENGAPRKMPWLLALFAVGEGTAKGEEKFSNKFLREVKAGSGVSIKMLKLPYTPVSVGGGDNEHGGIYYTLWKSWMEKIYSLQLKGKEIGLMPVPYAVVTALKINKYGQLEECNYGEDGIIVANSYSNFSGYKNNYDATNDLILEDNLGRKWVSCKVYGHIDKLGAVHIKGRQLNKDNIKCQPFELDESITKDTKNIMSSTTVMIGDTYVSTIQYQPFKQASEEKILKSLYERLVKEVSWEALEKTYIRILPIRESYPLTSAGKRSARMLEEMGYENATKLTDIPIKNTNYNKVLTNQPIKK